MGQLWTRSDWNDIIQRINDLADDGCTVDEPLEEVSENHIWTVQDIIDARDKLTEICSNSPSFSVETEKWTQDIIDELNDAISNCECEGEEGCTESQCAYWRGRDGTPWFVYACCGYCDCRIVTVEHHGYIGEEGGEPVWIYTYTTVTINFNYDYLMGTGWGQYGIGFANMGYACKLNFTWFYWPGGGAPPEPHLIEVDLGDFEYDCEGNITSVPDPDEFTYDYNSGFYVGDSSFSANVVFNFKSADIHCC